ncbi:hypothetical protein AGMMS49574_03840 [Bacteroidia bacterium]|nr:hypothetical protein AGMMS49574_03840 [Bacteroidia bacterium]
MAHDVFISYSSKDQKIVEGLSAYLEQRGIRCFVAYRDIPKTEEWAERIPPAIINCMVMVYIHSNNANQSKEINKEIALCLKNNHPILPFRIENVDYIGAKSYHLETINWIDAFPNPQDSFGDLCNAIQNMLHGDYSQTEGIRIKKKHALQKNKRILIILAILFLTVATGCVIWYSSESKLNRYNKIIDKAMYNNKLAMYSNALLFYQEAFSIIPTDSISRKIKMTEIMSRAFSAYSQCHYSIADSLFRIAARMGSSDADYFLGEMYYEGWGQKKNINMGIEHTAKAVQAGCLMACYRMGAIYQDGDIGIKRSEYEAKKYFELLSRRQSELENSDSQEWQYILGNMYRYGHNITSLENSEKAILHYEAAAEKNYPQAQYALYEMLGDQYQEKLDTFLSKAAQQGFPKAELALGAFYIKQRKHKAGYDLIIQAVHENYSQAMFSLGALFLSRRNQIHYDSIPSLHGELQLEDLNNCDSVGHYYLKKAIDYDANNYSALFYMGVNYFDGVGVNKDTVEAKRYFDTVNSILYTIDKLPESNYKKTRYPDIEYMKEVTTKYLKHWEENKNRR